MYSLKNVKHSYVEFWQAQGSNIDVSLFSEHVSSMYLYPRLNYFNVILNVILRKQCYGVCLNKRTNLS